MILLKGLLVVKKAYSHVLLTGSEISDISGLPIFSSFHWSLKFSQKVLKNRQNPGFYELRRSPDSKWHLLEVKEQITLRSR
jgi:hypothetical protein